MAAASRDPDVARAGSPATRPSSRAGGGSRPSSGRRTSRFARRGSRSAARLSAGAVITIDGTSGEVFEGVASGVEVVPEAKVLLGWARDLGIAVGRSRRDGGAGPVAPQAATAASRPRRCSARLPDQGLLPARRPRRGARLLRWTRERRSGQPRRRRPGRAGSGIVPAHRGRQGGCDGPARGGRGRVGSRDCRGRARGLRCARPQDEGRRHRMADAWSGDAERPRRRCL